MIEWETESRTDVHKSLLEYDFQNFPQCHLVVFRHTLWVKFTNKNTNNYIYLLIHRWYTSWYNSDLLSMANISIYYNPIAFLYRNTNIWGRASRIGNIQNKIMYFTYMIYVFYIYIYIYNFLSDTGFQNIYFYYISTVFCNPRMWWARRGSYLYP